MKNKGIKDLTTGSIPRHLLVFAIPILLGNLLTTGYSIINTIWVGRILGGQAVGAVAVSFPVVLIISALASGATLATSLLIARFMGGKNYTEIQRVVDGSWSLAAILVVFVTAGGIMAAENLLRILGTPQSIMAPAAMYLKITFMSYGFTYMAFLIAAILRGVGNTIIPMLFMIVSTIVNAVLDPLLIIGVGPFPKLGLNGAAIASLIAAAVATLSGFIYIKVKFAHLPMSPKRWFIDAALLKTLFKIGFPSFVQQTLISVGYGAVTVFVNAFGAAAIAAYGITNRIDAIVAMPAIAVMQAASTLTAQNLGAGRADRIKAIFKWGIVINTPVILAVAMTAFCFPETLMRLFVVDPAIIGIGASYFRIVSAGYLMFIVSYVAGGIVIGAGKTVVIMLATLVSLCVARIPCAVFLSKTMGLNGIWCAILISFTVSMLVNLGYYFSGRWNPAAKETAIPAAA